MNKFKKLAKHILVFSNGLVIHTNRPELFTLSKKQKGYTVLRDSNCILDLQNMGEHRTVRDIINNYI